MLRRDLLPVLALVVRFVLQHRDGAVGFEAELAQPVERLLIDSTLAGV